MRHRAWRAGCCGRGQAGRSEGRTRRSNFRGGRRERFSHTRMMWSSRKPSQESVYKATSNHKRSARSSRRPCTSTLNCLLRLSASREPRVAARVRSLNRMFDHPFIPLRPYTLAPSHKYFSLSTSSSAVCSFLRLHRIDAPSANRHYASVGPQHARRCSRSNGGRASESGLRPKDYPARQLLADDGGVLQKKMSPPSLRRPRVAN